MSTRSNKVELIFTCIIAVVLITVVSLIDLGVSIAKCSNYSDLTKRETKYSLLNGCYVNTGDRFVPIEEVTKTAVVVAPPK